MDDPPAIIDTHAHLASPRLAEDFPSVLERAAEAGVVQIVAIATTAEDSEQVLQIAQEHPHIFAAVGIHPNDSGEASPGDWEAVERMATSSRVVALGETGLDRYWNKVPFDVQQDYFDRHLALGESLGLPVVIHSRDCQRDVFDQLARRGHPIRGVQHSFTGTWDEAQALLDLGLHLSFAGMLTFANKALDPLRDVAARVPSDRILVETDAPYLSPHPFRGQRNEPSRAALTAVTLAQVRGVSVATIAEATTRNARALFGIATP